MDKIKTNLIDILTVVIPLLITLGMTVTAVVYDYNETKDGYEVIYTNKE